MEEVGWCAGKSNRSSRPHVLASVIEKSPGQVVKTTMAINSRARSAASLTKADVRACSIKENGAPVVSRLPADHGSGVSASPLPLVPELWGGFQVIDLRVQGRFPRILAFGVLDRNR